MIAGYIIAYGTSGGLSFLLLFICIILSVETVHLNSQFMLSRSSHLRQKQKEAHTRMQSIHKDLFNQRFAKVTQTSLCVCVCDNNPYISLITHWDSPDNHNNPGND